MKLSFSIFASLIFLFTLMCVQHAEAGFSNNGRMQSKNLNLSIGGTLDNNGDLIGKESVTLSCDTLSGNGLICSPQISIKTKIFAYNGTIDCSGKCTITTSSPFDETMFKSQGGGEFIIILEENRVKNSSKQAFRRSTSEYEITDELSMQVE